MDKLDNEAEAEKLIKEFNKMMLRLQPNKEEAGD